MYTQYIDVPTRQENKVWAVEDDPTSTMVKRQRKMKRGMYAIYYRSTEFVKAIKLEGQKAVTTNWYTTKCLPDIRQDQEVNVRELIFHHDSAIFPFSQIDCCISSTKTN